MQKKQKKEKKLNEQKKAHALKKVRKKEKIAISQNNQKLEREIILVKEFNHHAPHTCTC